MEDEFFDDYTFEDFETTKSFSDILFEMERNGTILRQWENGEPDGIEPKQKPKEL